MRLKNNASGLEEFSQCLETYYYERGRNFSILEAGTSGRGGDEGDHYFIIYRIDNKYKIKYSMPTAIRTFACIFVAMDNKFYLIEDLTGENILESRISGDSTTEAVVDNLVYLDEYFTHGKFITPKKPTAPLSPEQLLRSMNLLEMTQQQQIDALIEISKVGTEKK